MGATTPGQAAQSEGLLTQALRGLYAVAESYPDLKANQSFLSLQQALADTEGMIAGARQGYNAAVRRSQHARRERPDEPPRRAPSASRAASSSSSRTPPSARFPRSGSERAAPAPRWQRCGGRGRMSAP